ncbi:MAG: hypothetical protein WBF66_03780 [Dehalococcoidia bacterium]
MTTAIEERIDRLLSMARAVLDRLERGDKLSEVLPQARAVAGLYGDAAHMHWLDCEIYGLVDVPFAEVRRKKGHQKAGAYRFCVLHTAAEVRELSVDGVLADWRKEEMPDRSAVLWQSVGSLERSVDGYREPAPHEMYGSRADEFLQLIAMHGERRRVLDRVRAYLYQYMNRTWSWALGERDNLRLLGPDYRIVVGSLDALETGVGQELVAALVNLGRDNSANWCAAGLLCRNVVMKLGRTLWQVPGETWESELHGRALQIGRDKELNCLRAFLDYHYRRSEPETRKRLRELEDVARGVYNRGSKGKRALRHAEAQQLVVDTFELVKAVDDLTGLEPVTEV